MSPLGRSPMKGGICHIRGFESLNYLKPYWLTIITLITRRPLNQVSDCISLSRSTWILSGSFFVASYYIIRFKKYFLLIFFKLRWFRLYILSFKSRQFHFGWILKLPGLSFYIFILLNKYITFRALVIWAIKILKKF